MPWYKTGTVSVTLNSNAVIGTGTAFIANSRVGDAFRGPDGAWYEVTNIASNTALSISPNYQGVTNATGGYALAPMQGYVKDSADALRGITNTYGTKLAALGTTGNYDVLPVVKGGTGGTTPAAARTGLGLGTSATLSVTTIAERALPGAMAGKVADAGFRGISGFLDLRGSIFETGTPTDLSNTGFITGFATASTLGIPSSALSGSVYVHLTVVTPLNGTVGAVGATTIRTARGYDREVVSYATSATTWSAWSGPNVRLGADDSVAFTLVTADATRTLANPAMRLGLGYGLYTGWGDTGSPGANFICNNGKPTVSEGGGFTWRTVNVSNSVSGPTMQYTSAGTLNVSGPVNQNSDRRLKKNDVEILDGLEKILQVRPVEFDRRDDLITDNYPHHGVGVIAQELNELLPILVTMNDPAIESDVCRVNYTGLIPYLISAIKQLKAEIDNLKGRG